MSVWLKNLDEILQLYCQGWANYSHLYTLSFKLLFLKCLSFDCCINTIKWLVSFLFRLHLEVHCRDRNNDSQLGDPSLSKYPTDHLSFNCLSKAYLYCVKEINTSMRFFSLKKRTNKDQPEDDLFLFANHEQFLSTITAHLVIWDNFVDKIWQLHSRKDSIQWMEHPFTKMDWEY